MSTYIESDYRLAAYIRRHPYVFLSLLIHVVIISLISNHTPEAVKLQQYEKHEAQKSRVSASVQKAKQADIEQRTDNIEKIKSLIEKSITPNTATPLPKESPDKDDTPPKTPEELLADAKKSLEDIKKLTNEIRAEELARVLKVPKEEAHAQVAKENLKKELQEQEKNKPDTAVEDTAKSIQKLEQEAHAALTQRQMQLDKMRNGTNIQMGNEQHGSGQRSNGSQTGNDSQANNNANTNEAASEINSFLDRSTYSMPSSSYFDVGFIPEPEGTAHKKMGSVIGAGGEYAERIYLNSWYLIGPFVGYAGNELFHNPSYPPEQLIDLDAEYFGKDDRVLTWQYINSKRYPVIPPGPAENAVYYGYTEIKIDKAADFWLWVGGDDDIKIWLNEKLVWEGGYSKQWFFDDVRAHRQQYIAQWNLSEAKTQIHLSAGRNTILFKLSNGPNPSAVGGYFASLVLTK
ncbi:MAG: hypothetical protein AAGC78_19235 [Cellvibrio sp.]|uniref:hypothetical protein n=1 Tax=Cellvibrio sp. TaxID=1965322 RepID=UPI0031AC06FD